MDIPRILEKIRPNSCYTLNGDSYDGLVWSEANLDSKPSFDELKEGWELIKNKLIWEWTRNKRDNLLKECDYTQLPDFTGNKEAWQLYRNALRNVPQVFGDPNSVVWPTKPN
jgi:Phage tail assembly chaperone protein